MYIGEDQAFNPVKIFIILLFIKTIIGKNTKVEEKFIFYSLIIIIIMLIKNFFLNQTIINMDIIKLILSVYLVITISNNPDNKVLFSRNCINYYAIGTLIASILAFIYYRYFLNQTLLIMSWNRFASINNDANYFASSVALAISGYLVYIFTSKKIKISNIIFLLTLIFMGALSLSRGFIISMIPNVLLFFIILIKTKNKKIMLIMVPIIVAMAPLIEIIEAQFSNRGRVHSIDSGRLEIWTIYGKALLSRSTNFLFGLGEFNKDLFFMEYGVANVAHNFFLGSMVSNGFLLTIGIILYYFYFYKRLNIPFHIQKKQYYYFFPIISLGISFFFIDGIISNLVLIGVFLTHLSAYLLSCTLKN